MNETKSYGDAWEIFQDIPRYTVQVMLDVSLLLALVACEDVEESLAIEPDGSPSSPSASPLREAIDASKEDEEHVFSLKMATFTGTTISCDGDTNQYCCFIRFTIKK